VTTQQGKNNVFWIMSSGFEKKHQGTISWFFL